MGYIESGKKEGATIHLGGERVGKEGYFIEVCPLWPFVSYRAHPSPTSVQPTIFTDTKPEMKIVQEEIFGPVACIIKFADGEDIIRQANDTVYGLAAAIFTKDLNRALVTANKLKAGTVWINCVNILNPNVPFGGFKQSGSACRLFLVTILDSGSDCF